jgi:hypothetical protein
MIYILTSKVDSMDEEVKAKLKRYYSTIIVELCMMLGAGILLKLNYGIIINFCIAIFGFIFTYILLELELQR